MERIMKAIAALESIDTDLDLITAETGLFRPNIHLSREKFESLFDDHKTKHHSSGYDEKYVIIGKTRVFCLVII